MAENGVTCIFWTKAGAIELVPKWHRHSRARLKRGRLHVKTEPVRMRRRYADTDLKLTTIDAELLVEILWPP